MEHLFARPEHQGEILKVFCEVPKSDRHSYLTEGMWAEFVRKGRYRLRNFPFAIYGYSFGDIVRVDDLSEKKWVKAVVFRSGHSTYRLFLADKTLWSHSGIQSTWHQLEAQGCRCEHATERLIALDVPPDADICQVETCLHQGEGEGLWKFELGHRSPLHTGSSSVASSSEINYGTR